MNDLIDQELGQQLGSALRGFVGTQQRSAIAIEQVVAGAKRRRVQRRAVAGFAGVALMAGAVLVLAQRADPPSPVRDSNTPVVRPEMLPAYATVEGAPGVGEPVLLWAGRGGQPMGGATPRIDVWQAGGQRLVIKTVDNSTARLAAESADTAVATSAAATAVGDAGQPWGDHDVTRVTARGVVAAVEHLADDQYAVWITTTSPDRYTVVTGRGMSRDDVLAAVEALVELDGVLQPAAGFDRTEHADALPASTPSLPYAQVSYGVPDGPSVATWGVPAGRASIELLFEWDTGRLVSIDGRDVMLIDQAWGQSSAVWLDPSGVGITVWQTGPGAAELVPFVKVVTESQFHQLADDLSTRLTRDFAIADQQRFGPVSVVRRAGTDGDALCLATDAQETCAFFPPGESPINMAVEADIDGHWVIFGYREIGADEQALTADGVTFSSPDGSCCDVQVTKHNGGFWYVTYVGDAVDVVTTNLGNVFGGIVGDVTRPLVASRI